jgi:hypothetical protein
MTNDEMTWPTHPTNPTDPADSTDATAPVASRPSTRRHRRKIAGAGLVAAGLVGGVVLAGTLGASADTVSPSSPPATGSATQPSPGGAAPVRSDEKAVSSTTAATLKAAALKAVPGGTVIRVETDAGDAVYEAHMQKADGTLVTVKFDKNLKVTKVETGMGQGDPAGKGGGPARGAGGGAPTGAPSAAA